MDPRTIAVLRRGIESGVIASIPQVLLPKLEEHVFMRKKEDADLGPRLVVALTRKMEKPLPEDMKWVGAASFHFAYAAFWGTIYALVQERAQVNRWSGGIGLGAFIYLITFPRWGGAVLTGAEEPPRKRSWKRELLLATAPLAFGVGTALLYGRGPKRSCSEW